MARVTVEDCIDKVDSPYELVLVAKERAVQLNSGIETETVYLFLGYTLSTITKSVAVGLLELVDI